MEFPSPLISRITMRILKQNQTDNKRINVLLSCISFNDDDDGWDFPLTEKWRKIYGGPKKGIKMWFVEFYDRLTLKGATKNN
jgi:hypothetical protein